MTGREASEIAGTRCTQHCAASADMRDIWSEAAVANKHHTRKVEELRVRDVY
jgi:hypothetical protein